MMSRIFRLLWLARYFKTVMELDRRNRRGGGERGEVQLNMAKAANLNICSGGESTDYVISLWVHKSFGTQFEM